MRKISALLAFIVIVVLPVRTAGEVQFIAAGLGLTQIQMNQKRNR